MPNLDQPIVTAAAGASSPWGSAGIQGNVLATLKAEVRHGIAFDLGLGAYINLDANFQKYIAAELTGQAMAEVRITGQVQVPLNLFDEIGLAVRLKLSAEAAAGVSLRLGLSAGDLLSLVQNDLKVKGLPLKLFVIFLDEVTFGGGLYAKAAASAMAYVNLVVTGRALQGPTQNEKPGFNFLFEMGAGLKAGAGFRFFVNAGITNFDRLVSRSVDVVVDEVVSQIIGQLPPTAINEASIVRAFSAPAKIAFRTAYEIGILLGNGTEPVPVTSDGAKRLALRCCQVILEESQRYLLQRIATAGLLNLQQTLESELATLSGNSWDTANSAISALGLKMTQCPDDPFATTSLSYWSELVPLAVAALDAVSPNATLPRKPVAILWAAMELMRVCSDRLDQPQARASFSLVGLNPASAQQSFTGSVVSDPGSDIRREIRGNNTTSALQLNELIQYLLTEGVQLAIALAPDVKVFLEIFQDKVAAGLSQVAEILLTQLGPFKNNAQGRPDVQASLSSLAGGLSSFLEDGVRQQLEPIVQNVSSENPDLRLYFDEVLMPSMSLSTDLVFDRILTWDTDPIDKSVFTEALSSVLIMLLGRSLAVTTDILMTTAQREMQDLMFDLADHVDEVGLVDTLTPLVGNSNAEDIEELCQEVLRIGGEVFGPLPPETRVHIREAMFQLLEPLPLDNQGSFVQQLADNTFVPDPLTLDALSHELAGIAGQRFQLFVTKLLLRLGQKLLEDLLEVIKAIQEQVQQWLNQLNQLALDILALLADLAQQISQLIAQVGAAFTAAFAELRSLISMLSTGAGRNAIRSALVDEVYKFIKPILTDNIVYKSLPRSAKQSARNQLRNTINDLLDNSFADAIWEAIEAVSNEVDDLMDRFRDVEPGANLASEISGILVDWFVDRVLDRLGHSPTIPIGFEVAWNMQVVEIDWSGAHLRTRRFEVDINLGSVHLNLSWIEPTLRSLISGLQLFESAANDLAEALAHAFGLEQELAEAEHTQSDVKQEQTHVNTQLAETLPGPRSINIVEPKHASAYDRDVTVQIELEGVPQSFLGLGENEQQRVFVWLDGVELELDRFEVETALDGLRLPIVNLRDNIGVWGQHFDQAIRMSKNRSQKKKTAATWALDSKIPAGRMPKLKQQSDITLRLRTVLKLGSLYEGLHTILIVIAESDSRIEQTATFVAVPASAAPKPPTRVIVLMPGKPQKRKSPRKPSGQHLFEHKIRRKESRERLVSKVRSQKIKPQSKVLQRAGVKHA